jgi:glycosyltransferase involved in cell wall biosynthesis
MAAKILIVTSSSLCRQPRPLKEATALARAGYDVRVLSVQGRDHDEQQDAALLSALPFTKQTVSARSLPARLHTWLARKFTALGVPSVPALGPYSALLRVTTATPADLTIVHTELGLCVGHALLGRRRVAADFEDWHSEDLLPSARRHRPLRQLRAAERELLHRAAYVVTTSGCLADALHARYSGTRPHVLTNSFPLQPAPPSASSHLPTTRHPLLATSPLPSFFWFSQTLGPGRGLEAFLAAWQRMRSPGKLVLLGEPVAGYADALLSPLSAEQRARVQLRPLVSPTDLPGVIAQHDVGLALEQRHNPNHDLTISNKILQYLNAGLAVVASDTCGQREVLARGPVGLLAPFEDPAAAAGVLDSLLQDRPRLAACQRAARALAESHYCWEREEPRLLALVERALA